MNAAHPDSLGERHAISGVSGNTVVFVTHHDIEEAAFMAGAGNPLHDRFIGQPTQEWQVSLSFFEKDGWVVFDPLELQSFLVNPMILWEVVLRIDGSDGGEGVSMIPDHGQVRDGMWTADLHGAPEDTDSRNLLEHRHGIWNMLDAVGGIDLRDNPILNRPWVVDNLMLEIRHWEFVQIDKPLPTRLHSPA